ncbi:MAG: glycosyltransferase family 4 protein [Candidatus Pedobacter colombiensis]|uniref:Glycosyltransferase family 4 protein n=1 Tax=Candidatus Pedobacter colombiensis TaxID=3121371 RepID=A0AAJ5W7T6_9SPHI|nr:glycosyltransferase family 4 protein [Pedobacter sp.]WEK19686.1 MAG: glycosyltransferase family 4 protein [Pedobacter sp.]
MSIFLTLIITISLFAVMLIYFRIADHYNIIDHPNERSSHTEITIRGGGIIYVFAGLLAVILHTEFWLPVLGMLLIGTISFIDDRISLSNKIRFFFHLTAVTLLFIFLNIFQIFPIWMSIILYIFVIGIINAYNFMDGINGITGVYSLVVLGGLQYVNYNIVEFIESDMIWLPILASLVFLFFNFRRKAKCFAGDVGSVTIAFWIVFLLLKLIIQTGNYTYILFLTVYGVDAVFTIIHRLMLKENIFEAHRLHFYQILANDQNWEHIWVSSIYAVIQLVIVIIVVLVPLNFGFLFLLTTVPLALVYIYLKPKLMFKID